MPGTPLCLAVTLALVGAGPAVPAVPWEVDYGLTEAQLLARVKGFRDRGYRLVGVSGYHVGADNRYAAVWEKRTGPDWQLVLGQSAEDLGKLAGQMSRAGFRPVCVSGYQVRGEGRLATVWEKGASPSWEVGYGLSGERLTRLAEELNGKGYRPTCLSGYAPGGFNNYAALWERREGPAWKLNYALAAAEFQDAVDDLTARGFRPLSVSGYSAITEGRFASVWERRGGAWILRFGQSEAAFQEEIGRMKAAGYRPVSVSGFNTIRGDFFCSVWER